MSNTEQPIEVGTGGDPAQDSAPAAVPVAPAGTGSATSTPAKSDDGGMLSAYMPAEVPPCGMKPGVCLLFALLLWVLLFEFCAICVSDKLTVGDNDAKCGWEKVCAGSTCVKYKDQSGDDAKKNENAGNTFIGFGILSFFLLIAMVPIVCDLHYKFCAGFQTFISSWTLNLICTAILWLFVTVAWGNWVDANTCDGNGAKHGDGINLMITAWFFLTFFYVPLSVPMLQRMLFGDNACE